MSDTHTHKKKIHDDDDDIPSSDSGRGRDHAPESMCEQMGLSVIPRTATSPDARKTREGGSLNRKTKQNNDNYNENSGRGRSERVTRWRVWGGH